MFFSRKDAKAQRRSRACLCAFASLREKIILRSLTDDGFSLPQEPYLIHIYTSLPLAIRLIAPIMLTRPNSLLSLLFLLTVWSATPAQTPVPSLTPNDDAVR